MHAFDHAVAKREVGRAMLQGCSWREAVQAAGVQMSRATAYRLRQRMLAGGEEAVHDRRQGHASKVRGAVRTWLEGVLPAPSARIGEGSPSPAGGAVRRAGQCDPSQSGASGAHRERPAGGKISQGPGRMGLVVSCCWPQLRNRICFQHWRWRCQRKEGRATPPRLARATPRTRRQSLLTLLFLGVVGLRRPWDLRGYAQEGLALLTTRRRAYGYRTVERFLSQVAQAGGAEAFTDALARWTTRLWKPATEETQPISLPYYVDGHRKPVFSDYLLPRGVIGRTGKILGCRTLLLLHDEQGHPLLATTHRGDLHLTLGTPSLLTRYETATDEGPLRRLVIDREGMAAEFLAKLAAEGRCSGHHPAHRAVSRAGVL